MYKGKKTLGSQKKCDNNGDGIYELVGKWRALAKKNMHKLIRKRGKIHTTKQIEEDNLY